MGTSNLGERKFKKKGPRGAGQLDLARLVPGQTVCFETDNSTWYITATIGFRTRGADRVMGVAITGNSNSRPKLNPLETVIGRYLEVGKTMQFGPPGSKVRGTSATIRRIYRQDV